MLRRLAADRRVQFAIVGASGILPNLATIYLLTIAGTPYFVAAIVAIQAAIAWNFLGAELLVWRDRRAGRLGSRAAKFWLLGNTDLLRLPVLAWLVESLNVSVYIATVATFLAFFVMRFVLTNAVIYRRRAEIACS